MVGESQEPVGSAVRAGGSSGSNKMPTLEVGAHGCTPRAACAAALPYARRKASAGPAAATATRCAALSPSAPAAPARRSTSPPLPRSLVPPCPHCRSTAPNLTTQAERASWTPVVGRKKEIERVTQVSPGRGRVGAGGRAVARGGGRAARTARR